MVAGQGSSRYDAGAVKVLRLLESLRQSEPGQVIYTQVERMLADVVERQSANEQAYLGLAQALLDAYAQHLPNGSTELVQLKLLQARLQPPLSESELAAISQSAHQYAQRIEAISDCNDALFREAVNPLLQAFGLTGAAPVPAAVVPPVPIPATAAAVPPAPVPAATEPAAQMPSEDVSQPRSVAEPAPASVVIEDLASAAEPEEAEPEDVVAAQDEEWHSSGADLSNDPRMILSDPVAGSPQSREGMESPEHRVDAVYRSHLDAKRRDIQKLQTTLAQRVLETITQNEEFGVLLEVVLGELHQVSSEEDLEELRWTLIREIEKLNKGHHELADKLDSTHHYLQLIESDSRQLSDELTRVRLLSLTDELTSLPNRRAFLRRLEDEVARVQRYGFPLSLALIDLDHFKQINDRYGHAGGDEVLGTYSKGILSIFRHHDLVARYGGEEFAVLLPNTDHDGAQRALTKVKKRAAETRWKADGKVLSVPTFSAGVSLYKPGETVGAFIERADKALYRAKRLGRNRVELDTTYQAEGEATETESESETASPETASGTDEG